MKAAILYAPHDLRLEEVNVPAVGPNDVLVKIRSAGICGSDIHFYQEGRVGAFTLENPILLGHECAGEIAEVGVQVKRFEVGDRVVIEPGFPCGKCRYCRIGRYNLCERLVFYSTSPPYGAFAEYALAVSDFVYRMPKNMSFEDGAMVEPVAVAAQAMKRAQLELGDKVAVLGAGTIGLLTLQAAKLSGASEVYITDILDYRLKLANRLGAKATINAKEEDPVERVLNLTGREGADVVIEAVGGVQTAQQTTRMVRSGGTVIIVGQFTRPSFPMRMVDIVNKELDIRGVRVYANVFPAAIKMVGEGSLNVRPLITHRFPLDEVQKAIEVASNRLDNAIKVQLNPWSSAQ